MEYLKLIRVPREWVEQCRQCKGTGHVIKRQHFALWTPEEYKPSIPPAPPPYHLPPDAYICTGAPGSSINEAVEEGIEIAKLVERPVAFAFNGFWVICRADSKPEPIVRAWWIASTGKTYEQVMEDR